MSALFEGAVQARDDGELSEALMKVLELLSQAPDSPRGKLLLANLFYLAGCPELAATEVSRLRERYPDRESLSRLLKVLDPSWSGVEQVSQEQGDGAASAKGTTEEEGESSSQKEAEAAVRRAEKPAAGGKEVSQDAEEEGAVLAETDFDFEDLDLLDEDD